MFGLGKKHHEPEPEPNFTPGQQEPEPETGMVLRWDMSPEEIAEEVARWTDTPVEEVNSDDWLWMPDWRREELKRK